MGHRPLAGAAVAVAIAAACSGLPTPPVHRGARAGSGGADLVSSTTTAAYDPQLVACTLPDSERDAEATIGPMGGALAVGGTRIDIPAGAVTGDTPFKLEIPSTTAVRVEIHAESSASFAFRQPVTITIDYGRCAGVIPSGALLEGVYIDSSTGRVLQRMGAAVDTMAHTISFWTGHLSGYAVAY